MKSALGGMGLSFAMAFLVLNLSTGNLNMAFLSTLTVAGIVATSLGLGVVGIMKWPLGISESISVVILIGFSMDYVLHLAGMLPLRCRSSLRPIGILAVSCGNRERALIFFDRLSPASCKCACLQPHSHSLKRQTATSKREFDS